ncbi:heterokaryon incompatibility protein-domain-containing protein, partial [Halenospora varia]
VSGNSFDPECLKWLVDCLGGHPSVLDSGSRLKCRCQTEEPQLPTRVLSVGSDEEPPFLFESNASRAAYTTLSYCWGTGQATKTMTATLEEFKHCIPLLSLPQTLRDAAIVTRSLDIKYIWIDALCIIQDSALDWASEAPKMESIYSNATLVIAARDSPASDTGLFFPREPLRVLQIPNPPNGEAPGRVYVRKARLRDIGFDERFLSMWLDALGRRGWAYQEGILASRTVHFTRSELGWSCMSLDACQCKVKKNPLSLKGYKPLGLPSLLAERPPELDSHTCSRSIYDVTDCWYRFIMAFTSYSLTVVTDRLPAMAGIASELAAAKRGIYGAYILGIWLGQLGRGLCWSVVSPLNNGRGLPMDYAPSWSWGSLNTTVRWH